MFAVLSEEPGRGGQFAEPESRPGTRPNCGELITSGALLDYIADFDWD